MRVRRSHIAVFLLGALGLPGDFARAGGGGPAVDCGPSCESGACMDEYRACVRQKMDTEEAGRRDSIKTAGQQPCQAGSCNAARTQATSVQRGTNELGQAYRDRAEDTQRVDKDLLAAAQKLIQSAPPGLAKVSPTDARRFESLFSAQSLPPPADLAAIEHPRLRELAQEIVDNRKFGLDLAQESSKYFQRADDAKKMLESLDKRERRISSIDESPKVVAKGTSRKSGAGELLAGGRSSSPGGQGGTDASSISSGESGPRPEGGKSAKVEDAKAGDTAAPGSSGSYGGNDAAVDFGSKIMPFSLEAELKKSQGDGKLDAFLGFALERADLGKDGNALEERFGLGSNGDGAEAAAPEDPRDMPLFRRVHLYIHKHPNRWR